jgi:hypothetical protein
MPKETDVSENKKIHDAKYGNDPFNFDIAKRGDTLCVDLVYPPYEHDQNAEGKVRHVYVNQESVRASDGIRIHYDFTRDGFVVEQPRPRLVALGENNYSEVEDWIEVGFFQSWAKNEYSDDSPGDEDFARADREADERTA